MPTGDTIMSGNPIALESLESRTLFAATPSPTVQADLAQVQADVQQIKTDRANGLALIQSDRVAIRTAVVTSRANVIILQAKLRSDVLAFAQQFKADHVTLLTTLQADLGTLKTDFVQLRVDRGNATLVAADLAKIAADRAKIFEDKA